MPLPKEADHYTYADYLSWDENERIEIMDGQAIMMAPPSRVHQEISGGIFAQIHNYLEGKKCRVYAAPFAVRPFEKENDTSDNVRTVLEPDITIVCDTSKLDKQGCKGAPDLVMEILSPSTARHDKFVKLNLYARAGIKEYWIIDPIEQSVQVFELDNGHYEVTAFYTATDIAKVGVLDGCFVELSRVFTE